MLREEQVAELLKRVEQIVGKGLPQTRGNLRVPENRAAAVWELLVMETASQFGSIEYEPEAEGSPDICLHPQGGRELWIEIAYLYPRFWKEERQSNEVIRWLLEEAKRRDIPSWKIQPELDGLRNHKAGPVRLLPKINERKKFLKEPEVIKFFEGIVSRPTERRTFTSSRHTLSLYYSPNSKGPYGSSSGLGQEAPKVVEEHAVYRVLRDKAKQHHVKGPTIICIGSDQSPALSTLTGPGLPTFRDGIKAAFSEHRSISGVIIVRIQDRQAGLAQFKKVARGELFLNRNANFPLTNEEAELLSKLDFNRWKYTYPLQKWGNTGGSGFRRVSGTLVCSKRGDGMEIEVPTNVLVGALAGKTNLFKEFRLDGNDIVSRALNDGWVVESCSLKPGDIEAGEAPKLVIGLSPPILPALLSTKRK